MNLIGKKSALIGLASASALMALTVLPAASAMAATTPTTLYVSTTGSDSTGTGTASAPYATIQKAVSAAASGDTIFVEPGTYKGTVSITEPLTLAADPATASSGAVVLDAGGETVGIDIAASHVTLTGMTIENANEQGVLAKGPISNLTITNDTIEKNDKSMTAALNTGGTTWEGLQLMGVTNSQVLDNNISNNGDGGIYLTDETGPNSGNLIANNTVENNAVACGITLASHVAGHGVYDNQIINNTIEKSGGTGILMATAVSGGIVKDNVASGNKSIDNGLGGIILHTHVPGSTVANNVITYNTVSGNAPDFGVTTAPTGIDVGALGSPITDTVITDNTISGETDGINLSSLAKGTQLYDNADSATVPVSHLPAAKPQPVPAPSPFSGKNAYIKGVGVSVTTSRHGTVAVVTAKATTTGKYTVEYEFLVENTKGQWSIVRSYQPSATFTYNPSVTGKYHFKAFALTEYQLSHKAWNNKVGSVAEPWTALR